MPDTDYLMKITVVKKKHKQNKCNCFKTTLLQQNFSLLLEMREFIENYSIQNWKIDNW